MSRTSVALITALLVCASAGCQPAKEETSPPVSAAAAAPAAPAPGLVVFIVVDQFRPEYLDQYAELWRGGFAWLREHAVIVENARLIHAVSATAPGHATLGTGTHPARHGIIGNEWVDRTSGKTIESIDDSADGASPRRMKVPSLGDRLKEVSPGSRVYGVGGKDRGAILTAGHQADGAFWYEPGTGNMISSSYYRDPNPAWLEELNRIHHPRHRFGAPWSAELLPPPEVLERLGIRELEFGPLLPAGLPAALGGASLTPGGGFYWAIFTSPVLDELTGLVARRLIEVEELGARDTLDVLTISFSALDRVGHRWGMDSPELLDTLLRLDLLLGDLFADLEQRLGRDRLVIALSSDHGVLPVPEVRAARGEALQRISRETILCVQGLDEMLDQTWGERDWLRSDASWDTDVLAEAKLERTEVERVALAHLSGCPGVAAAWSKADLLAAPGGVREDSYRALWSHTVFPDLGPDLLIQYQEGLLPTVTVAANHNSPYLYDRAVPMIFLAPGLKPGRITGVDAATIDFAPTLAALTGVPMPDVDGRPLDLGAPARGD